MDIVLCLVFLLFAGITSGLNVGLFSIDPLRLRIAGVQGNNSEKRHAKKIQSIMQNRNLLLVTLLIANALAIEALPLFLAKFVPGIVAVIISVTVVLFFSEIIPQGLCTSTPIEAGARLASFTQIFIVILYPIAKPISLLLDGMFGKQSNKITAFNRNEIRTLIALQLNSDVDNLNNSKNDTLSDESMYPQFSKNKQPGISIEEITIVQGVLKLTEKTVDEFYTPLKGVFMIEENEKLDVQQMANIIGSGFSRIPVYRKIRNNILGYIVVKRLCALSPADSRPAGQVAIRKPSVIHPTTSLFDAYKEFQRNSCHFAIVAYDVHLTQKWNKDTKQKPKIIGIITLNDIFVQMTQESISEENVLLMKTQKCMSLYHRKRAHCVAKAILKFNQLLMRSQKRNRFRLGRNLSMKNSGFSKNYALRPGSGIDV